VRNTQANLAYAKAYQEQDVNNALQKIKEIEQEENQE